MIGRCRVVFVGMTFHTVGVSRPFGEFQVSILGRDATCHRLVSRTGEIDRMVSVDVRGRGVGPRNHSLPH